MGFKEFFGACLIGGFLSVSISYANSEFEDGDFLSTALNAVKDRDWVAAEHAGAQISDPVGQELITWARLRAGEGEWWEYKDFLEWNPDWPGLKRLKKRGESVLKKTEKPEVIRAFFASQLPQTGTGSLRLAEALQKQGRTADARSEIIRAWHDLSLNANEQELILSRYKGFIARHHEKRLENLLWKGWKQEAGRMLDLVSPAKAALAKARIGLQRAAPNVDTLIEAVPEQLADDGGLAYDRFQWRMKKNRWDEAHELLVERTGKKEMGRPEKWASRRSGFARRAMRAGDIKVAYLLASQHRLTSGSNYADLEWLAGYLSLTYLDAPKQALIHFNNFRSAVKTPISFGRAGYWLGRTYTELGDTENAKIQFEFGAKYQTSFYGQLSAEKAGVGADANLAGEEEVAPWQTASFSESEVLKAAKLLHFAEESVMVRWFLTHIAEDLSREEMLQLANFAQDLDEPFVALGIAKQAAKDGIVLPKAYYPITDLAGFSVDVAPEIAMSIARRESELNAEAISPAGARGLMQIMPATARQVAGELGMEYSKARLINDWRYNATLGTAYLGGLLELYEGSYILAFAAYNAGPHRADAWIETYGDPRDPLVDPVDWIEHIPFKETRNYVMRVIESLHVYRARIDGRAEQVRLTSDLARG